MGICCMAQETQTGPLYQPRGVGWGGRQERVSKGRGYMYNCGRFMLSFYRKQQNSVKQLFNKKLINFLKKNVFQYQIAKLNNAKSQLLLHQLISIHPFN